MSDLLFLAALGCCWLNSKMRACDACGAAFVPTRRSQKFCQSRCAVRVAVRQYRQRNGKGAA